VHRSASFVAWVALGLLASTSVAEAQSARLERWLDEAERAMARGQERRAWALWERAAAREPADERAALRMAERLPSEPARVAAPDEALRARARAVVGALERHLGAAESPSAAVHRDAAWARAIARDHGAAIDGAAVRAGRQDRESAGLLQQLAALAIHRGDLAAAHRALLAAHRALPVDGGVLSDLGAVELALGRPEAAIPRFTQVLGGRPEDLGARRDLAGALLAAGRAAEAVALLGPAVDAHPDVLELRVELARAALEAGQPQRAEQVARGLVDALPDQDARGHALLGEALAAQRRPAEALAAFTEALRRDPDDLRAQRGLAALRPAEAPAVRTD
jgi:tetratricopeptide (TPR) repeat protein